MKEFGIGYGGVITAMLALAGAEAIDGNDTGVGVCVGLAAIAAAMYAGTIILVVAVELVKICKGEKKWIF